MWDAGLIEVSTFSYLIDQAEPTDEVRAAVVRWLSGLREVAAAWIDEADRRAVDQLLDPTGPHYVGRRDDVFVLATHTAHVGTAAGPGSGIATPARLRTQDARASLKERALSRNPNATGSHGA
ncbi:MAG: hypothetical protein M3Z25_19805 [Actinomycetota bacterium]|nr:hypothetical protein [Actinomycetota bacterium]